MTATATLEAPELADRKTRIIRCLAAGGPRAMVLATLIQELIVKASELGGLELGDYVRPSGELVKVTRFPERWLDRLVDAIDRGALEKMPIDKLVERMLAGPR